MKLRVISFSVALAALAVSVVAGVTGGPALEPEAAIAGAAPGFAVPSYQPAESPWVMLARLPR